MFKHFDYVLKWMQTAFTDYVEVQFIFAKNSLLSSSIDTAKILTYNDIKKMFRKKKLLLSQRNQQ